MLALSQKHAIPILVTARVRPMNKMEQSSSSVKSCITYDDENRRIAFIDEPSRNYNFDTVLHESSLQTDLYDRSALPLLHSFCTGTCCTLLVIGASQSGKTHSLFGPSVDSGDDVSSLSSHGPSEIRLEKLCRYPPAPANATPPIVVREMTGPLIDENSGVVPRLLRSLFDEVPHLTLSLLDTEDKAKKEETMECKDLYEALKFLDGGYENRSSTMMLTVKHGNVDLHVYECDNVHIPLRNNYLRKSFGGNRHTSVICTISPSNAQRQVSKRCLEFGTMARDGEPERDTSMWHLMQSILEEDECSVDKAPGVRECLRGATRQMDDELAVAKEELADVNDLLKTAALSIDQRGSLTSSHDALNMGSKVLSIQDMQTELGNIEKALSVKNDKEKMSHRMPKRTSFRSNTANSASQRGSDSSNISNKSPQDKTEAKKTGNFRDSLSLTVQQIELDLENTRKELMGAGLNMDEVMDSSLPLLSDKSSNIITDKRSNDTTNSADKILISQLQAQIAQLQKENQELTQRQIQNEDDISLLQLELQKATSSQSHQPTPRDIPNLTHSKHPSAPSPLSPTHIKTYLCLRPKTKLEQSHQSQSCISITSPTSFTVNNQSDGSFDFVYDGVIDDTKQGTIRTLGSGIAQDLLNGVNVCTMAYGVPQSGKTTTLFTHLFPSILSQLFSLIEASSHNVTYEVQANFISLYLEKLVDLLASDQQPIVAQDVPHRVTRANCYSKQHVLKVFERGKTTLSMLMKQLPTAKFFCFFYLHVTQKDEKSGLVRQATLTLADLAGFETNPKGGEVLGEAEVKLSNKSFQSLSNVVKLLNDDREEEIPYSDSKLTELLREGLGGNAKSLFFVTASDSSHNISETLRVLKLGKRVRRVVNVPHVNYDLCLEEYKRWLLATEVKLGELCGFVNELSTSLVKENLKNGDTSTNCDTATLWKSIEAIVNKEETYNNPCRRNLIFGTLENVEELKWRELSRELHKMPTGAGAIISRDDVNDIPRLRIAKNRAESLQFDRQIETIILRRQRDLLAKDKRLIDKSLHTLRKDLELLDFEKTKLEHDLGVSLFRQEEAGIFLKYIRRLCWRINSDLTKTRSTDINEITKDISGAPDLTGLVDLDTLLLERGFIKRRMEEESDDDDESVGYETDRTQFNKSLSTLRQQNQQYVPTTSSPAPKPSLATQDSLATINYSKQSPILSVASAAQQTQLIPARFASWWTGRPVIDAMTPSPRVPPPPPFTPANGAHSRPSLSELTPERHLQLEHDLRILTKRCIDLQIKLNEEKKTTEIIMNRHGSLRGKRLAQEVLELRKEKEKMMHNAKAVMWKLQEMYEVNKVLARKAADERRQVVFLEEVFQRLQDKSYNTILESKKGEKKLLDKIAALENVERLPDTGGSICSSSDETKDIDLNLVLRGKKDEESEILQNGGGWMYSGRVKRWEIKTRKKIKWDIRSEAWRRKKEREFNMNLMHPYQQDREKTRKHNFKWLG